MSLGNTVFSVKGRVPGFINPLNYHFATAPSSRPGSPIRFLHLRIEKNTEHTLWNQSSRWISHCGAGAAAPGSWKPVSAAPPGTPRSENRGVVKSAWTCGTGVYVHLLLAENSGGAIGRKTSFKNTWIQFTQELYRERGLMQKKGSGHAKCLPFVSNILHFPQQILSFVWGNKLSLYCMWKQNGGQVSGDLQVWVVF